MREIESTQELGKAAIAFKSTTEPPVTALIPFQREARRTTLTPHQRRIVTFQARGLTNEEITTALPDSVKLSTVKTHANRARTILGIEGVGPTAILHALRRKEIDAHDVLEGFDLNRFTTLTPKEREVLKEFGDEKYDDHSAEAVSQRLSLGESTVKTHIRHIKEKLDARSINHMAALFAAARQQLPPENRALVEPLSDRTRVALKDLVRSANPEEFKERMYNRKRNPEKEIALVYEALGATSITEALLKGIEFGHINLAQTIQYPHPENLSKLTPQEHACIELILSTRGRSSLEDVALALSIGPEHVTTIMNQIHTKLKTSQNTNPIISYLAAKAA